MRRHPIIKFFGLTVLYAAFIVGIFVLQFKTETVITKVIGAMRITLSQTKNKSNETLLKNQFQIMFNGMNFSSTEKNPVTVSNTSNNSVKTNLVLASWEQLANNALALTFTDGSKLIFSSSSSNEANKDSFSITAQLSKDYDCITIPYSVEKSKNAEVLSEKSILFSQKTDQFIFTAPLLAGGKITLYSAEPTAMYTAYQAETKFKFMDVLEFPTATVESYRYTISNVRNAVVSNFSKMSAAGQLNNLTELEAVAYISEMLSRSKFNNALSSIPDSFKKSSKRTYLSAPFFNNLSVMNKEITVQTEKFASMVTRANASKNLDIFTIDGIADYILREKNTLEMQSLLSFPSKMETFEPSLLQASAIIDIYAKLKQKDEQLSSLLGNIIIVCLDKIESCLAVEEEELIFTVEDTSVTDRIKIGQALINYGIASERSDCTNTGRVIINKYVTDELSFATLAELYPTIVTENKFYPHTQILGYYGSKAVWAWTCAPSIDYKIDSSNAVNINIDFTLNYTHYVIFNGVPTFNAKIQIQQLNFRSDPHYEIYNSSGYVYEENIQALYLKSRHKSKIELIKLFCNPANNFTQAK